MTNIIQASHRFGNDDIKQIVAIIWPETPFQKHLKQRQEYYDRNQINVRLAEVWPFTSRGRNTLETE